MEQHQLIRSAKTSLPVRGNSVKNSSSFIPDTPADTGLTYPESPAARSRWIIGQRGQKKTVGPSRPYAWFLEKERDEDGSLVDWLTIFLTNKECPWHCLMCDLWQNTLDETVPDGAIVRQIDFALEQAERECGGLSKLRNVKLYNAGSFFDVKALSLIHI